MSYSKKDFELLRNEFNILMKDCHYYFKLMNKNQQRVDFLETKGKYLEAEIKLLKNEIKRPGILPGRNLFRSPEE